MNLLDETLAAIEETKHTTDDILFIGSSDGQYRCSLEEFKTLANYNYDNGYGSQEVADTLIIAFKDDEKLVRQEYDGSEGWGWVTMFDKESMGDKCIYSLFSSLTEHAQEKAKPIILNDEEMTEKFRQLKNKGYIS